jgi:hypothetical protein
MLNKVKLALRVTTNAYDSELTALISAAQSDLQIAGVVLPSPLDEVVEQAIKTYCKIHFLDLSDGEFNRLKASYDEQKAQWNTATGYTEW